ncbi:hypothetical protein V6N11_083810 [Hibiscus sabdariffa]|uniref:Uncharacterized protein n=2 Tax=Hibiscus sabdariffa TaxID=183260 RepID=A0ABR1ZLY3_9ROSI
MVDLQTVCCMCGDVGFPDKLFRCNKCQHRFQHSYINAFIISKMFFSLIFHGLKLERFLDSGRYCSNHYSEFAEPVELCDWCQSEERNPKQGSSSKKPSALKEAGIMNRSEYSGDKIKQESGDPKGKNSGTPPPRPTTRRYKLLKDVMC